MLRHLPELWYRRHPLLVLLLPLSLLYCGLVLLRRQAYRLGLLRTRRLAVPVIVVGNISVGGTGKTPLVAWLAERLAAAGYRPGLVARGYGGRARSWPQQVRPDSDPAAVGDEPVLLARLSGRPMAVGPDRVAAAEALLAHSDCDLIISDDGLQHYRLARDIEIAVIDGVRRLGNGLCLPAGPLREPPSRLQTVDFKVCNGVAGPGEYAMRLSIRKARRLNDAADERPLAAFRGSPVHALAGIGHPQRFFEALRRQGLEIIPHSFPDHHAFQAADLAFAADGRPVLMTEKDAVKCQRLGLDNLWLVPLEVQLDARFEAELLERLETCSIPA
ncbi:tetraacyldisaccharide 4'-kinase [Thiohalobacter sp. IOR34]|uniref:tetraacyldisaccharide 4'-kinase n=1 Tax=Thiohalobacter sp. IOR34 TaxID=3057176 RepID=UPI0025B20CE7|nr:tetraacyldisaccharide 4'-kinase [Thiohalobacter sp. IOR34]WJW76781.1 tetraacyldisaccharide 4'-kinase [Thiohalobacter sp. IOR34]